MRVRLSSISRFAATFGLLASLASNVSAYDESDVRAHLQPYIGAWGGVYMINTTDLQYSVAKARASNTPNLDNFQSQMPVGGLSIGVAYNRVHVGLNAGYQMADGKTLTAAQQASTTEGLFPNYQYEVIPLDISLDLAMLPNEYPVNFLLGASIGTAFVNMQLPIKSVTYYKDTTAREIHVYDNTWQTFNFLTGSAYAGARINLLRRLNLEAQAGWRLLRNSNLASDGDAWNALGGTKLQKDSTGAWIPYMPVLNALPIDLSGLYVRVDVRWTFASQADKEKVSLLQDRPRMMAERMALMPRRYTLD